MTVDKFARYISKRYKINDIDIKELVKKVENDVSNNISNNLNYIENKVIEQFKYELQQKQLGISNFEKELKTQNKRSLENFENIENITKKLKFFEDKQEENDRMETIKNINMKLLNSEVKMGVVEKQISDISSLQQETQKVLLKLQTDISDTSKIDDIQKKLTNDLISKFTTFSTMIYDRIATEVEQFKHVHDNMDKDTKNIEKNLNLHLLLHKKDVDEFRTLKEQFNNILPQISELKSIENLNKDEMEKIKTEIKTTLQKNNNISLNILDFEKKVDEIKNLKTLDADINITANIDKIIKDIKLLDDFVKSENIILKANIEKINEIMDTKIKEVAFFNAKEKIKVLKNDVENLVTTEKEIGDSIYKGRQLYELPLIERQTVNSIHSSIESIVKKLNEELNKIDEGMGELDTILNATSLKYLNTKIKDNLNDVNKKIVKIKEYLNEEDKVFLSQKLKEWDDGYKSYWDNYFS